MPILTDFADFANYPVFKRELRQFDTWLERRIGALAASDVDARRIIEGYEYLGTVRGRLAVYAADPDLADQARAAEMLPAYDVQAEIAALDTTIADAQTWIETNFPAHNGYLLYAELVSQAVVYRQFTPAQTAGLRTALQAVADQINGT